MQPTSSDLTAPNAPRTPALVRGNWLLGVGPDLLRRPLALLDELSARGDVVGFRLPGMRAVLVNRPELIQRVLHDRRTFNKQMRSYRRVGALVGDGLATSDGDFWLRQRRIAQPAFHRQRIAGFGATMVRFAEAAREQLGRAGGRPIDVFEAMNRLTLDIACEALLGPDAREDNEILGRTFTEVAAYLVDRLNLLWYLPLWVPTGPNRRCQAAVAALDAAVHRIIARRRAQPHESLDLLSMMLHARDEDTGACMSDTQLRDEVVTMLLGGHETTSTALTWALHLLAGHPDVQARLHAELDAALGGRAPTVADLEQLPYTRMVVEETMRLYPPIWLVARNAACDVDLGGFPIARGTAVFLSPWGAHRSPALWDAPEVFRPERFAPEHAAGRHRYAYFPFVGGPRQCIGNAFALMEARLVLAVLLQRHYFTRAPGSVADPEPLLTLRPKAGLRLLAHPRGP
ncbi:MAG TPA: cytochrome P450 [Nannocystis sp.]